MPEDIDAVIAWVDGEDPAHRARLAEAMRAAGRAPSGRDVTTLATRFAQRGEIYLSIASLLAFAPWLRRIHLVTDAQRPALLDSFAAEDICPPDRIRVVDHREIFHGHEEVLPTFNSRTIETMLWRIPGLADRFLYLNDDFFLAAPIAPDFLVAPDGRLQLRGRWQAIPPELIRLAVRPLRRILGEPPGRPNYRTYQALAALMAGYRLRYLRVDHHPHILRRETFARYFEAHPDALTRQIRHRFRHISQFQPVGLANHLELAHGSATVAGPAEVAYLSPGGGAGTRRSLDRMRAGEVAFGCAQSLDEMPKDAVREFRQLMADRLGPHLPRAVRAEFDLPAAT